MTEYAMDRLGLLVGITFVVVVAAVFAVSLMAAGDGDLKREAKALHCLDVCDPHMGKPYMDRCQCDPLTEMRR